MALGATFATAEPNSIMYNGKELQDYTLNRLELGWYDYGRRFYDPQLVRFHTLDPLAEKFPHQSPFVYANNNPIRYIDFMGMNATDTNKEDDEEAQRRAEQEAQKQKLNDAISRYLENGGKVNYLTKGQYLSRGWPGAQVNERKSGNNLYSLGLSLAVAGPHNSLSKSISFGVTFGNGAGFYATKKEGKGVMLSAAVDFTIYENLGNKELTPYNTQGEGGEIDSGYSFFGGSLGWAKHNVEPSPYRSVSLSGSYGMDYGAAIWETKTTVMPLEFMLNISTLPIATSVVLNFLINE